MVVKVYISGISGNKEVKKRQQRVLMILDAKHIGYEVVDITEPGKEADKDFMQSNSTSLGATQPDVAPRHPLPPQIFNGNDYCGDYDQFDLHNELDTVEEFLKVEIPADRDAVLVKNDAPTLSEKNIEEAIEKIATNGISSSRETSVETEGKTNGKNNEAADVSVEEDPTDAGDLKAALIPSEDLILSEQAVAE